ncbi:MAG: dicarboxylate/amino acid:cation symporter [Candidatus Omnitrophica bacterium]|nr:dicarboxylate/amino acid:cation symporter [Candidatus Omnitrophota bacterium]
MSIPAINPVRTSFLKNYGSSILLLCAVIFGAVAGLLLKERAVLFKPFGDIFLNLLFTVVVPLVFFSISSAVAGMSDMRRLGKIMASMAVIFVVTGVIACVVMIIGVKLYPPASGVKIAMQTSVAPEKVDIPAQIVRAFTVSDFGDIFSKKNMLALIVFSLLIGLSALAAGPKGRPFVQFLLSGNEVMTKAIGYVMVYAPVGLGSYFAYLVGTFGSELLGSYARSVVLYYPLAIAYFVIFFSLYAWMAAGRKGLRIFWANILPVSLTAWGTGSGLATLPVSLETAKKMGVPEDVREVVIAVGASMHSDGSCLAAVLKMAVLFGIFGLPFDGLTTLVSVVGVALLCGTVISGIPSGGMLGELLIISMFGFPLEAMPIITMIGTIVDPPATMVNVVGDNVSSMLVARVLNGKDWMQNAG